MNKERLDKVIYSLLDGTDKFLLSSTINKNNIVEVFIDGESMVSIQDCINLARNIEEEFDRDEEDFELRVSSAGSDKAFKDIRQLIKYIDKELEFYLPAEKPFKGRLKSINNNLLEVEQEKGKGKKKEIIEREIDFEAAEKIKPLIKF